MKAVLVKVVILKTNFKDKARQESGKMKKGKDTVFPKYKLNEL